MSKLLSRTENPSTQTLPSLVIGIDPGRLTGVCIWDRKERKIKSLTTSGFWNVIDMFERYRSDKTDFMVVLEDPQQNSFIFARHKGSPRVMTTIAQGVGRNKEQAFLLIEYLTRNTIPFRTVKPTSSKWKHDYFVHITRWEGKTNEHERDAAKMVFNL